ncbi:ATP-binding protein [Alicyclobacillus curvatus]|nr:ATP-binding protein [Alicyclobacillus curvatus]
MTHVQGAGIMSLDTRAIDLTDFCTSFPEQDPNDIFRGSLIKQIRDMFSRERKVLFLEGIPQSGKTTLAAQFTKYSRDRSVSFFVGQDYWTSNADVFLQELCQQMINIPNLTHSNILRSINLDDLDHFKLAQTFNRLYTNLRSLAQRTGPFYFVIDGLDKIEQIVGERGILDYIPRGTDNIFVLLTGANNSTITNADLGAQRIPIQWFSMEETEKFLSGYFSTKEITDIYETCDGMPGYIKELRRQAQTGSPASDILPNLPTRFVDFLDTQWQQIDQNDQLLVDILSIASFEIQVTDISTLALILDVSPEIILSKISGISFIDVRNNAVEVQPAYKNVLSTKLSSNKTRANDMVIRYHEALQGDKLQTLLPELYQQNDRYEDMKELITTKSIVENLSTSRQLGRIRYNLRLLSSMAFSHQDWSKMAWANLADAVFSRIVIANSPLESEVSALLSLDNHVRALELATGCTLPEDRLYLIATVSNYMVKNSIDIPDTVLQILEDAIELIDYSLDLNDGVIDRLLDVCANVLPVNAPLAMKLLQKLAAGTIGTKQNLLDFLITRLLVTARTELDTAEEVELQLSDSDRKSLVHALRSATAKVPAGIILEQVAEVEDVDTKLFLIQIWCESNVKDPNSLDVITEALRIMISNTDESPTLSSLRQISLPLLHHEDIELVKDLVERIDLIKETLLNHPMDQYAWLELTLARVVNRWSADMAVQRLYGVYFELENLNDVDTRCHLLARVLRSIPEIVPHDEELTREISEQLKHEFTQLLLSSADQFTITKKLLTIVTRFSVAMAYELASQLNTQRRRNLAYGEILRIYTSQEDVPFNFSIILKILEEISFKPYKDLILVHTLESLSSNTGIEDRFKLKFIERVNKIESPIGRAFGIAHYIKWLKGDIARCDMFYQELIKALNTLDPITKRIEVGFRVTEMLASNHPNYARDVYSKMEMLKREQLFSDVRVEDLYIKMRRLMLRTIPDILKANEWREQVEFAKDTILHVPPVAERCELLSNLAIRCKLGAKDDLFKSLSLSCLELFESSADEDSRVQMLFDMAPMLFEYERTMLYQKIETLPAETQDVVLSRVARYLMSKRPSCDPVDITRFQGVVDYADAMRVTEVIEHMHQDGIVYSTISSLVDCISVNAHRYRNYAERQLLSVATRLKTIIHSKLPDPSNIRHDGYMIISLAELCRLRDLAHKISGARANQRWKNLCYTWEELRSRATDISNASDRVYVLATCGVKAHGFNEDNSDKFLLTAEQFHGDITNHIDRADRFQLLADSYYKVGREATAHALLAQTIEAVNACSREEGRDSLLERSAELAYSIDPALADSIISKVDSEAGRARLKDNVTSLILHSNPARVEDLSINQRGRVMYDAAYRVFESLCSGRGSVQHSQLIGKWMHDTIGHDFETIDVVISWFIENSIAARRQSRADLDGLFAGSMQVLEMLRFLGSGFETASGRINSNEFYSALSNVETYRPGERLQAMENIYNWLATNSEEYIKIYEPYFSIRELDILRHIPAGVSVTLCFSSKTLDIQSKDLKSEFKKAWKSVCDLPPPRTKVYIFHTNSGNTPMHNRYILTKNAGLELSTSLNGFGTKDSTIRYLDFSQKAQIESELVDPLIIATPQSHLGEELDVEMFVLQ